MHWIKVSTLNALNKNFHIRLENGFAMDKTLRSNPNRDKNIKNSETNMFTFALHTFLIT